MSSKRRLYAALGIAVHSSFCSIKSCIMRLEEKAYPKRGSIAMYVVIAMANHVNDLVIDLNVLLQKKIEEVSHHTLHVMVTLRTHHSAIAKHTTKVMQFVLKQNERGRPQNGVTRSNLLIGESGLRLFLD